MRWLDRIYQATIVALALLAVWLVFQPDEVWVYWASVAIWFIFTTDYVVRLGIAPDRRTFLRENIPDLLAILPFDLLSGVEAFEAARALRLARLVRVLRAGVLLWRATWTMREILRTNGLGYVLLAAGGVILFGGLAIHAVEPRIETLGDGIWWSLVTTTTVGYGDIAPSTIPGRIVAGMLMVFGISTFGLVTGAITPFFVRERRSHNPHVGPIVSQLERWDDLTDEERRQVIVVLQALADGDPGAMARSSDG
jgi:voltage-gated potassium channel